MIRAVDRGAGRQLVQDRSKTSRESRPVNALKWQPCQTLLEFGCSARIPWSRPGQITGHREPSAEYSHSSAAAALTRLHPGRISRCADRPPAQHILGALSTSTISTIRRAAPRTLRGGPHSHLECGPPLSVCSPWGFKEREGTRTTPPTPAGAHPMHASRSPFSWGVSAQVAGLLQRRRAARAAL